MLELLSPDNALLGRDLLEHCQDSGHHSLEAAEVHVGTFVHSVENLVGVLLNLVLNVHLSALLVHGLAGEGIVKAEVVGELGQSLLPVCIIQKILLPSHTEEEPGEALVVLGGGCVLEE